MTPIEGSYWAEDLVVEGFTPKTEQDGSAYFNNVSDRYFETLGMQLLAGLDFNATDVKGGGRIATTV